MADIAEGLVQSGVRRLVVAGGETSGAVVDRLGIPGFLVGAEIAAGVPVLRAVGANARRDAACAEIRQFRRPGIFLRRARADALSIRFDLPAARQSPVVLRSIGLTQTQATCGLMPAGIATA